MPEQIHYLGLLDVARRIRDRSLTSEAVTAALLKRIDDLNPRLNCFLNVLRDQALEAAREADREIEQGFWRGPLHGVPIGLKDILHMKDLPTSAGTVVLADIVQDKDSAVAARLRQAGAVLIGKLHMTEGAGLLHHPDLPRPTNPWSADHWTGVSSSGSGIAVAAGLCYGAIGTDTGGSIRLPSAANNLTGIKPTWGRVSRHGLVPLIASLDHIGPMARSTDDAAALLQAIAGADPMDPTSLCDPVPNYMACLENGVDGMTVGIDRHLNDGVDPDVARVTADAENVLRDLGYRIREISFPSIASLMHEVSMPLMAEIAVAHEPYFSQHADRYGPWLKQTLEEARKIDGVTAAKGYQARDRFCGEVRAVFRDVDVVLVPGMGTVTPTWTAFEALQKDLAAMTNGLLRFLSPFNIAGTPTLSLPGGFSTSGMPVGVQLVAWRLGEDRLCAAGHAFQRITAHHVRHPPL